jgi:hypothetical protein
MSKLPLRLGLLAGIIFALMVWTVQRQRHQPPVEFSTFKGMAGAKPSDPVGVKMERLAEQAALDAWQRYHMRLQIHVSSLPDFERYLDRLSKEPDFRKSTEKDQRAEGLIGGAFIGEAIRRVHGGYWLEEKLDLKEAGPFPLQMAGGHAIWPVNWAFKRLMNGPEDNIYHKYRIMVSGETNGLNYSLELTTNVPNGVVPTTNHSAIK